MYDTRYDAFIRVVLLKVILEGVARYRDERGKILIDHIPKEHQLSSDVTEYRQRVKANTNYTVRVCARTGAGCGSVSDLTRYSVCTTPPNGKYCLFDIFIGFVA